jgi:hypothetical protein
VSTCPYHFSILFSILCKIISVTPIFRLWSLWTYIIFMYWINSHLCDWRKVSVNCSVRLAVCYYTNIGHAQENVEVVGGNNYVVVQGCCVGFRYYSWEEQTCTHVRGSRPDQD